MNEWSEDDPPTDCAVEMRFRDGVIEWRRIYADDEGESDENAPSNS